MERSHSVGVISYKELEIATQRKSVVKAWNTEPSKQKKSDLHSNIQMTSIFLWSVFLEKKKYLKIYVFHFLIVFQADFFLSYLLSFKTGPFHPKLQLFNTKNHAVMCFWYTLPSSKVHNFWSHCFREEARSVNTVTEKACVGSTGFIVWQRGWSVNSFKLHIL